MGRDLAGLVVAVTGGARGIGLATGRAFAEAGARVALGDFDGELAASCAAAVGGEGFPLDVRHDGSWISFLAQVRASLGPVDLIVNSAGVAIPGEFVGSSMRENQLQMDVNFGGVLQGMRRALPAMLGRGSGHIVNIASAAGRISAPRAAVYIASKQAVVGLSEAVRWELRGTGVHVTAVLPTVVATEMAAGLRTRGLPIVSAEGVAAAVRRVAASRRPPSVVMVPRWLRAVGIIDAASPQWLRDLARRIVLFEDGGRNQERSAYYARIARLLDTHAEEMGSEGSPSEHRQSPGPEQDEQ
jgi:hypothetical protein